MRKSFYSIVPMAGYATVRPDNDEEDRYSLMSSQQFSFLIDNRHPEWHCNAKVRIGSMMIELVLPPMRSAMLGKHEGMAVNFIYDGQPLTVQAEFRPGIVRSESRPGTPDAAPIKLEPVPGAAGEDMVLHIARYR